nr:glutathione s-transferase delta-1 [Protohermes costalis]
MVATLYHFAPSAPSRAAVLAARALGIDVEIIEVNLFKKEQLQEKFVSINPQHTVPTLDDGGFILWESRAISAYLVKVYGKNDTLYSNDVKKRAVIDQRLYFDCGTLYPRIRAICYPILFLNEKTIPDERKTSLNEALSFLDKFLEQSKWVAGENLTIADISCVASVSSIEAVGWDFSQFKNISNWLVQCAKEIPGYDENKQGATIFGEAVKQKLTSN